jgi:hypothetical protein
MCSDGAHKFIAIIAIIAVIEKQTHKSTTETRRHGDTETLRAVFQ